MLQVNPSEFVENQTSLQQPYSRADLTRALWSPQQFFDIILADPKRLAATVSFTSSPFFLILLLLLASILCTIPYGLVIRADRFWSIAALYFGSLLICLPSLNVFGSFFGVRMTIAQSLMLSSVISAVAGLFTLGFAPILWFLRATMTNGDLSPQLISFILLFFSIGAGLVHLARLLASSPILRPTKIYPLLLGSWSIMLLFVSYRMARTLELLP